MKKSSFKHMLDGRLFDTSNNCKGCSRFKLCYRGSNESWVGRCTTCVKKLLTTLPVNEPVFEEADEMF